MDRPRQEMIDEILQFVSRHPDSTASLAVTRRILGEPPDRQGDDALRELRQRIDDADDGVLASLYDIIR
ncbi:MAG TPA: hypothetical protein VF282_08150 [Bacillota bacterium]